MVLFSRLRWLRDATREGNLVHRHREGQVMPLTKMEHYLVLTRDIEATRNFYTRVLGMKDGFRPPLGFPGYWLYLGTTPVIHIAEWETYTAHSNSRGIPVSTPAEGTGAFDHIAFVATDYDELLSSLQANGLEPYRNITNPNGLRQVFLLDPNGVKIEVNIPPPQGS